MSKILLAYKEGKRIPSLALGTALNAPYEISTFTELALTVGYRHFDVFCSPEVEKAVGIVLNNWILSGRIRREDIFVAAKLPPHGTRPKHVKKQLLQTLLNLRLSYVDLYTVSSPVGLKSALYDANGNPVIDGKADFMAMWPGMEQAESEGLTRSLGVAHCNIQQMTKIFEKANIKPANLQVELHPYLQQKSLVDFCKNRNIVVTAIVPKEMTEHKIPNFHKPIDDDVNLESIARFHKKTIEQIVLKWLNQKGYVIMTEDLTVFHLIRCLQLSPDQMKKIADSEKHERFIIPQFLTGLDFHSDYPFKN